ncbi:MAG: DUF605-domain-containing protein [Amphiamblys sp. WSBS2006]|nr:MAG: DUF605-domain-containing protein [Amphiamblys sp. WSBS2006]
MVSGDELLRLLPACGAPVKKFVQRGVEFSSKEPQMAYAFIYHAASTLSAQAETEERDAYLETVADFLEEYAEKIKDEETTVASYLRSRADRALEEAELIQGPPSVSTARRYLEIATYYDVLCSFVPESEEMADRREYAKWRAVETGKALKEAATLPPTNSETDTKKKETDSPTVKKKEANSPEVKKRETDRTEVKKKETDLFLEAEDSCRTGLSSIEYKDIDTAVGYLTKTIEVLHRLKTERAERQV